MYPDYFYSCDDDHNKGKFKKGIGGTGKTWESKWAKYY